MTAALIPNKLSTANMVDQQPKMTSTGHLRPRRTLLQDSVSLPGNKKQKLSHSPENTVAASAAYPSLPLKEVRSQESGSSDRSASKWFDRVNEHVPHGARQSTSYDDEPPFFMSSQAKYMPTTFPQSEVSKNFGGNSRMDSENEDLRGVIDDLTIENKRLKYILRNQRSRRDSPITDGQDKLFEVRMHGLPPEKRRELEFLLKNFATSVHMSVPSQTNSVTGSGISLSGIDAANGKAPNIADSGYASNSNSGQTSQTTPYGSRVPSGLASIGLPTMSKAAQEKKIKNYLHDIPDTLLPRRNPIVMSERAKMALVVRRLEQLFTGKSAAPGEHTQPMQQQEVSQMAARADARLSRKRKAEGSREAHILPPDSKINFDNIDTEVKDKQSGPKTSDGSDASATDIGNSISRPDSPDQRPTRPLDLDIHRAQVAAENLQYIRHLGLTSPAVEQGDGVEAKSWIYLNLLINMAQIHTINVTPDFVRRAIRKMSTKLDVSKDGHRVHWIGGVEGTIFSKEEEKALEGVDNNHISPSDSTEDSGTGDSSRRSKADTASNAMVSTTPSEDKTSGVQTSDASRPQISTAATSQLVSSDQVKPSTQAGSSFDYKPKVYRDRAREIDEGYIQDSDSSFDDTSRDSSGLVHALSRSNLNTQRKADEGLITFFTNPYFCSDYSGDKLPSNLLSPREAVGSEIMGVDHKTDGEESALRYHDACYFAPQFAPGQFRPSKDDKLPEMKLAPISIAGEEETQPIEFAVSGLGGVLPEDNFAVDVQTAVVPATAEKKIVPFTGTRINLKYSYKGLGARKLELLPSKLPPPSYIFFTSSSSSNPDTDEFGDDEESSETSSSADEEIPTAPGFLRWTGETSGDTSLSDDDDDENESSSVDMLALARAADPQRIAEQERQYMINQPGGRAVAGSLAATVGASGSLGSGTDIDSNHAEVQSSVSDGSDVDMDDE